MNQKHIEIKKLVKYYGKARGVTDVSFDVNQADFFGFIGPNGAALFAAMIGITALSREENRHTSVCLALAYAKYLMKDIR